MATSYPGALDTFTNPTSGDTLDSPDHASQHADINDATEALEAKVGTGSSTPTANTVLRGTGVGSSAYGQVDLTGDVTGALPVANGGTGSTSAANARTALGVAIGSDVQAWDTNLDDLAALTPGNNFIQGDGLGGYQTLSAANTFLAIKQAATTSATGVVELATTAEVDTGTDTGRVVTPDALAGSYAGEKGVGFIVVDPTTDVATGDGKAYTFPLPSTFNGMNLVEVSASVVTAGTTGTTDIQVHNLTQAADMLTTKMTIDSGETSTATAATPAVIDTANDDVATGDVIRIDVDAVSTTAPKGLSVSLVFRLP